MAHGASSGCENVYFEPQQAIPPDTSSAAYSTVVLLASQLNLRLCHFARLRRGAVY